MAAELKKDWSDYYKNTRDKPPSPLVVAAVPYVTHRGKAIDIGAGALKDTRYLLAQGFEVTALDQSSQLPQLAQACQSDKLRCHVATFAAFDFPVQSYDLAVAMFSLPFGAPAEFDVVFARIKKSLVKGGIFVGNFFGDRDEWHDRSSMTFLSERHAKALLIDMDVIVFAEKEFDGKTADGKPKH